MKALNKVIPLLVVLNLSIVSSLFAHDHGEMLKFDDRVHIQLDSGLQQAKTRDGKLVLETAVSEKSAVPFDRICLNGTLPASEVEIQIAIGEGKTLGTWQSAYVRVFENGRFWARYDLDGSFGRYAKIRIVFSDSSEVGSVEIYAVEGINSKQMDQVEKNVSPKTIRPKTRCKDVVPQPEIISREEWGAQPVIGTYIRHDPYRLTQHHTAGKRVSTLAEGIAEIRFIQDYHQNGRGWQDIGYHFLVDDAGRIYQGVPVQYRGTHTGGNNTGNVGISMFGNYHEAGQFPTEAAIDSLAAIWSWLAFTYDISPDWLYGHRNYSPTACPGEHLYSELPEIRGQMRKTLGFGSPYVVNPLPQPFSTGVSPHCGLSLAIRDDEEGLDPSSLIMKVNYQQVEPTITGDEFETVMTYQPEEPFPSSQHVVVEIEAADQGASPNVMLYAYEFYIEVEVIYLEVESATQIRNAEFEMEGSWSSDSMDVSITGLFSGQRLKAVDTDGSHRLRIYPHIGVEGDYRVLMAMGEQILGESAHYCLTNNFGLQHELFVEYGKSFDQKWGVLSPTPVSLSPDGGYIELSGIENLETRMVLDALRLELVDALDPPAIPVLKSVRVYPMVKSDVDWNPVPREGARPNRINNKTKTRPTVHGEKILSVQQGEPPLAGMVSSAIEVAWYPNLEGDIRGYRLFVSEDGRNWGPPTLDEEVLTADTTSCLIRRGGKVSELYVQLVAVDINGIEDEEGAFEPFVSQPSDIYGVGLQGRSRVLIVDNFDRMGSWKLPYHPFVRSHGEALAACGVAFDSCSETAVQTGDIHLGSYDAVFYFCGDDSRADESLAAADQHRLIAFLRGGGKLFISGSEIGYDFNATTSTELARIEYLLKFSYLGDLSGSNQILGAAGTLFEGLNFNFGTVLSEETYIEDYPDYIQPAGGSQVALTYGNDRNAAICYTGPYETGNPDAQLIFLAFTFETINEADQRAALMSKALAYFELLPEEEGAQP
ncbi:MAG: hypothetical protein CSA81_11805 [Acidobacteria bacterium]|nr:MAG: hypothetical protein CSA81_11805 [Acidobacteriota bacterium]